MFWDTEFDYFKSGRSRTLPDLGTQICPEPNLFSDHRTIRLILFSSTLVLRRCDGG